jgi:hypothetical protein
MEEGLTKMVGSLGATEKVETLVSLTCLGPEFQRVLKVLQNYYGFSGLEKFINLDN